MEDLYISARHYARKHGVNPGTVSKWAKDGRLPAIRTNAGWQIDPNAEPPRKLAKRAAFVRSDGTMVCQTCKRTRMLKEYSESGLTRGRCKDCANYLAIKGKCPTRPSVISYSMDLEIWREMQYASNEVKRIREEKIQEHARRIEAAGLAGDGKDWPAAADNKKMRNSTKDGLQDRR